MARSLKLNQKDQDICDRDWYVCDNVECEHRRRKILKELTIQRYRIRELERSFNRPFNDRNDYPSKSIDQKYHHDHDKNDNDGDDDDDDDDDNVGGGGDHNQ